MKCNWEVEEGRNYVSLLCGKPAVVTIYRRELGSLAVCRGHLTQDLYMDTAQFDWTWRVVAGPHGG